MPMFSSSEMEFDESVKLPSRRSVHQRLGKLEIGARKDKVFSKLDADKSFIWLIDFLCQEICLALPTVFAHKQNFCVYLPMSFVL